MDRKVISLNELDKRVQKHGPDIGMANVKCEGIAVIKDKDGNIKSTMKIVNIEDLENGTS